MKKYPIEITSGKGVVSEESRFYRGFAITIVTDLGEVILTAANIDNLVAQANVLMPKGFIADKDMVQDVSIFSSKKVTEAN